MWWIIAAVCWAYGLYLVWRVIHEGRTSQGSLCWVIVLLLVPPIAIPLFWLFGDRRLEGYIRARRSGMLKLDATFRHMHESIRSARADVVDPGLRVFESLAKLPWTRGNNVQIFDRAGAMYDSLVQAIEESQHTVLMQFYIYRDDAVGQCIRASLVRALARGVRVSLMYDELGCAGLDRAFFEPITTASGKVSGFRTVPRRRRMLRLNFRNHRKLVIVDGRIVYFGGMNVGCEYLGLDETIGMWRDTHARADGPVARVGQMVFVEDWHWAQGTIPDALIWPSTSKSSEPDDAEAVEAALLLPSGPADDQEAGQLMFLQLMSNATTRLWIATPYFVCEESILDSIVLAKRRGVDVRILVPMRPDSALVRRAAESYIAQMLAIDVAVYQYRSGFTHQKVLLCDNVATIGSANLDHRSMKLNFELTGIVFDAVFASKVADMLERDMHRAVQLPKDWWTEFSSTRRFMSRAARLVAPVL